ncbi:DUF4192 domain-containing protein [Zhihengliuella salsuginis]|uniref:DUF4192 domain-containing protein n=1 Tax=Zhihengliuella salsuginis TaxID=578222 RepID=A0ABQ3GCA0_9MICC|nr:DUF4192 domain-containing protein [Zhihengliuella salsuginis]GHD01104.1 hypothetical protein GCM10008096_04850 [Zhihengliuella salsuginis]
MTNPQASPDPAVDCLSVSDSANVLALVPHLLGFEPERSLALLLLSDKRLVATLRVDLPRPQADGTTAESDDLEISARVGRLVDPLDDVDSVLLVAYGDRPTGGPDLPYARLLDHLGITLALEGVGIVGAWYVGGGRWIHYGCQRPECCPADGNPVDGLEATEANAEMTFRGSAPKAGVWDGTNNEVWPDAARVREIVAGCLGGELPHATLRQLLGRWELLLSMPAEAAVSALRQDAVLTGAVVAGLHRYQSRNMLLAMAAGVSAYADIPREDGDLGYDPDDFEQLMEDSHRLAQRSVDFIVGDAEVAPDWHRLDRLWNLAYELIPATDGRDRSSLLTMMAWMEWARGRSTAAQALLERSGGLERQDDLALIATTMMNRGEFASWVQDRGRAWRPLEHRRAA